MESAKEEDEEEILLKSKERMKDRELTLFLYYGGQFFPQDYQAIWLVNKKPAASC